MSRRRKIMGPIDPNKLKMAKGYLALVEGYLSGKAHCLDVDEVIKNFRNLMRDNGFDLRAVTDKPQEFRPLTWQRHKPAVEQIMQHYENNLTNFGELHWIDRIYGDNPNQFWAYAAELGYNANDLADFVYKSVHNEAVDKVRSYNRSISNLKRGRAPNVEEKISEVKKSLFKTSATFQDLAERLRLKREQAFEIKMIFLNAIQGKRKAVRHRRRIDLTTVVKQRAVATRDK